MPTPQDYINYLVTQHKVPRIAATAAVARFQQESGQGLNPTIVGDKSLPGGSVGLGQWNRERKTGLLNFAGDRWSDPYRQLDYFVHEGQGPEARAYNQLVAAQTPEAAAQAMMNYERPQGWTAENPAGGHGYANTVRNYYALTGQPSNVADGPKGQEMYPPAGPAGPVEAAGGGAGSEAGAGAAAPATAPAAPVPWWQNMAKSIGKMGEGSIAAMGGGQPVRSAAVNPAPSRIDQGDVATIDPQQAEMQRQQLALLMQKLNSGKLF